MICVSEAELEIILDIFSKHAPDCEARAFGSRYKWTSNDYSDLDLALVGKTKLGLSRLGDIRDAFEESDLPFRVDVLDWHCLTKEFRAIINGGYEVIYTPEKKEQWRKVRLGDVAEIIGGGTPSTTNNEYWGGKIPWVTPKDLTNYTNIHISKGERNISQKGLKNSSARLLPKGTVLLTTRAPIGYVAVASTDLCTNQGFKSFVVNEKKLHNLFLFYWLKGNTKYLQSIGTGTTFMEIPGKRAKEIEIPLPPLPTQRAIAATLSCLDEKIELNNRINANLEAQAQAIFKSWFVDFEPFKDGRFVDSELGRIPEGWEVGKLTDFVNIKYGKAHQSLNDGDFPVYGSGGLMRYAEKPLYNKESVLIPRKGTLNNVMYITEPFWTVDTMFYTEMKKPNVSTYIYQFIKQKDLVSMNAGTAVPSMTTEILNALNIIIPPDSIIKDFYDVSAILYNKQKANHKENRTIAAIRDALLPKLMSGEIEVEA